MAIDLITDLISTTSFYRTNVTFNKPSNLQFLSHYDCGVTYEGPDYTLNLQLVENLPIDLYNFFVYSHENGKLFKTDIKNNAGNFDIIIPNDVHSKNGVFITAMPKAKEWKPNLFYNIGDVIFPTNTTIHPYFYRREIVGTSADIEPVWTNVVGDYNNDNAITNAWKCISTLVQPVTNAYIKL